MDLIGGSILLIALYFIIKNAVSSGVYEALRKYEKNKIVSQPIKPDNLGDE